MHICLEYEFYLCQRSQTMAQICLLPVVVNKVVLEYSRPRSFKDCLLSHHSGGTEWSWPTKTTYGP